MEINVNDENFTEEVLNAKIPVLVDFYATWCGPCRMLAPIVEEISDEYDGKIKVARIDVDEAMGCAREYGIRSIPTLILFENGAPSETLIGYREKNDIIETLGLDTI